MDALTVEDARDKKGQSHQRNASSQRPSPRRQSTKGPLELGDDPLSTPVEQNSSIAQASSTRLSQSMKQTSRPSSISSSAESPGHFGPSIPVSALSHLLRPSLFHPLPPPPLAYSSPPPNTPISKLLTTGHFRAAALLSARLLASPPNPTAPLTAPAVYSLWQIRLVTLCLLGLDHVAADESRALGDVIDAPVYRDPTTAGAESTLPWSLRLLALRLQARAEGDISRAVVGYFALAREARRRAKSESAELWDQRLRDLETRVAGLLVEMGDLDGAARMLEGISQRLNAAAEDDHGLSAGRLILVYLQIGNVEKARALVSSAPPGSYAATLSSLVEAADGNFADVIANQSGRNQDQAFMNNLAVCFMYSGQLENARTVLSDMTSGEDALAFPTLLFNLTTIFELTTDKPRPLKLDLTKQLLQRTAAELGIESSVADLKL